MNKLFALVLIVVLGCQNAGNSYFTGIVEYAYSFTSDLLNADSIANTRPARGILRYDTLNYQSVFIGPDTQTYFYSGGYNKVLSKTGDTGNYQCEDYGTFTDSVVSFKLYDTDEKILGYSCKILEIQKKNSWLRYYVSNDLRIAPATYNKHASYNWDFYGDKANGGLILRSEHRLKYFTVKSIATSLSKRDEKFKAFEMDDALFSRYCR
jgi:hypothetical protein